MTGWRVGYLLAPAAADRRGHEAAEPVHVESHFDRAVCRARSDARTDGFGRDTMLAEYARRRERILAGLRAIPGVTCTAPEGAFYVFPNISAHLQRGNAHRHGGRQAASRARVTSPWFPAKRSARRATFGISYATSIDRIDEGLRPIDSLFSAEASDSCSPARLEPIFSPRPWGSLSLAPFFPEQIRLAEPIGEAWMTGSDCRFANGPFAGQKLGEAWPNMPIEWAGTAVEPRRRLSPARKIHFLRGQTLRAGPSGRRLRRAARDGRGRPRQDGDVVCVARTSRRGSAGRAEARRHAERFQAAIADGTAEDCLERVALARGGGRLCSRRHRPHDRAGACCSAKSSSIPISPIASTITTAATRKGQTRPLHIEKALEVMRFGEQTGGKIDPVRIERGAVTGNVLCRLPLFCDREMGIRGANWG